ncbi:TIGR01741 family protein [Staphylococcus aureus]|nr:TIGR01741 family protein [Staphylococcus aureus]
MIFEEKLSQMYNEIANEISGMIPVEWEKVYTIAYVDDEGGEVVFNYTKPGSDELNYYTYIPREYNVSEKVFYDLWTDLYRLFKKLRNAFKEDLIPVEWEKVYTMAYIDDGGGEVFFNYTKPGSDDLNYYTDIPKEYNISVQVFDDLWMDLYDLFEELRDLFKEEDLEPWTSCEFDFTSEGKLKVSLDYIDWINTEFDQLGRENYYMYKKFGVIPERFNRCVRIAI